MSTYLELYQKAAKQIIIEQQAIIGPIAYTQARKVEGINIDGKGSVIITGENGKEILGNLVNRYADLFGQASVEVCKEAVREIEPPLKSEELPDILK